MNRTAVNKTGYANFSFSNSYKLSHSVGEGAYGKVFKGTAPDGKTVALKEILLDTDDEGIPLSTLRELSVLKKVQSYNCKYLVQMLDISLTKVRNQLRIYVVFEFMECDLARFLSEHVPATGLPSNTIRDLSEQLLRGTEFLHSHRIIHRDLKPANVLIDRQGRQLKITDFGLSRILGWESTLTPVVVTLWYRSPEILLQSEYLSPCDVWAAGCIIAELFNRKALFSAETDLALLSMIFNKLGFPEPDDWPATSTVKRTDFRINPKKSRLRDWIETRDEAALELLERMIHFNPKKRITASDALAMPYFHPRPTTFPGLPFASHASGNRLDMQHPQTNTTTRSRHSMIPAPSSLPSAVHATARHSLTNEPINRAYPSSLNSGAPGCSISTKQQQNSHPNATQTTIVKPSCSASSSSATRTTIPVTNATDTEQYQHNLMLSVVQHVIDDTSKSSSSSSSYIDEVPHRPVTRQQTRASRRYTQPTLPTSFDSSKLSKACPDISLERSNLQLGLEILESGLNTHSTRQKKTARRRTLTGSINRNSTTSNTFTKLGRQSISEPKTSSSTNDSDLPGRLVSVNSSFPVNPRSCDKSEQPQRPQVVHRRLTSLMEPRRNYQLHQSSPNHLNSRDQGSFVPRSTRYSVLLPISEQVVVANPMITPQPCKPIVDHSPPAFVSTKSKVTPTLCSPSKQARVLATLAVDGEEYKMRPVGARLGDFLDDEELGENEAPTVGGDVVEDSDAESDSQPINTSLGINTAMTGLALVTRTSSMEHCSTTIFSQSS